RIARSGYRPRRLERRAGTARRAVRRAGTALRRGSSESGRHRVRGWRPDLRSHASCRGGERFRWPVARWYVPAARPSAEDEDVSKEGRMWRQGGGWGGVGRVLGYCAGALLLVVAGCGRG